MDQRSFIGKVLDGTYRIEELIRAGGMGAVYRASHTRLPRPLAVKILHVDPQAYPEALARFRREAEVTSKLRHPHIVEVVDFNLTPGGVPYLVMELLDGDDLERRLTQSPPLSMADAVEILRQSCAALQAAHQAGVVHRDLKPSNLFMTVTPDGRPNVKIVDFGVSKIMGVQSRLTATHSSLGTPRYMAPEQARGRAAEVDERTDVFALSTIAYEMLGGRPPFGGDSIPEVLYKIVHEEPVPLRQVRPDLPPALTSAVERGMSKAPAERPRTMRELWTAIETALSAPSAAATLSSVPPFEPLEQERTLIYESARLDAGQLVEDVGHLPQHAPRDSTAVLDVEQDARPSRQAIAAAAQRLVRESSGGAAAAVVRAGSTGPPDPRRRAHPGAPPAREPRRRAGVTGPPQPVDQTLPPSDPTKVSTLSSSTGQFSSEPPVPRRSLPLILAVALTVAGAGIVAVMLLTDGDIVTPPPSGAVQPAVSPRSESDPGPPPATAAGTGERRHTTPLRADDGAAARDRLGASATDPDAGAAAAPSLEPDAEPAVASPRRLWLQTSPGGARVTLDGRLIGTTPIKGARIAADGGTLRVRRAGHRSETLRVEPGSADVRLRVELTQVVRVPMLSTIRVMATSGGQALWADVYVDGKKVGQSPLVLRVKPGRHQVEARRKGFKTVTRTVQVGGRRAASVVLELGKP